MDKKLEKKLEKLCQLIRYDILTSTTVAGSGHPTSSLSAVELMTTLFFAGFFKSDLRHPSGVENDKLILSKGHASPLLYSMYHAAGLIDYKELMTLRKFGSRLEGHPNPRLPYVEVATGSLGQGLSVGVGMALGIELRIKNSGLRIERKPKVFVLLGDSEMAEGQVWEAMEIAGHYKLNNLIGIIDVNRLGQYGETEEGWDIHNYEKKAKAFGWETIVIDDGHDLKKVFKSFNKALSLTDSVSNSLPSLLSNQRQAGKIASAKPETLSSRHLSTNKKPVIIIARTIKGKGVSFLENKNGWHGKTLNKEQLKLALEELGKINLNVRETIQPPKKLKIQMINDKSNQNDKIQNILGKLKKKIGNKQTITNIATREAYGEALVKLGEKNPNVVVLDAEVANSTFENKFQQRFPERFFEMFIAEENMMSVALGLSKIGYIPFVSTFAAFLTQTFDQVRMAQYSDYKETGVDDLGIPTIRSRGKLIDRSPAGKDTRQTPFPLNLKIVGSHAGVSIGPDGPSQMGLEDMAMFRSILNSTVFYPSDAISTNKLTKIMAENQGIFYMRTTRGKTPIIYDENEKFEIGGFKVHKVNKVLKVHKEKTLIFAAGITLHEALKAQKELAKKNIMTTVVDLYCVKPLNSRTIEELIKKHSNVIVVEDHYPAGGIGEAIASLLVTSHLSTSLKVNQPPIANFSHLCVRKIPKSGAPEELLRFEEIDYQAIIKAVQSF